jgi:predicted Zn-dependent protease with MMP-like domain
MTDEEFEEHVRAALDSLPEEMANALENVAVVVEEEEPGSPGLLGSFTGHPRGETLPSGALPGKIVVYRRPLLRSFPAPAELERQIRITVLHEIAHYFGLDERRLDELGYG